ncbi:MAG: pyridoxal phosphate-dependent aminotransferase [Candidatus Altiarchaeota archaeon]
MEFARRMLKVTPSATFKYSALAKKPGIINLTIGRPDFSTPTVIKEAAKKALDEDKVHYTPTRGIPELREKIALKLEKENKIVGLDKDRILVGGGAKSILFQAILAVIDKGDVFALPDPSWVSYESMIYLAEGDIHWLPLKPENGFIPDDDFLAELENSKAKFTLLNSPNNPTGAAYPQKIIDRIVDICERKDMWLISDEPYELFQYEGRHYSPGSRYEKTITVNAFSKTYSMTGWRIGYAACKDKEIIDRMALVQEQSLSCPTSFAQYGSLAAFTKEANDAARKMAEEFKKRRDYCMKMMEKINALCVKPSGAFYLFPYFKGEDDMKLAEKLLEKGLGVIPGSPFGSKGNGCIRISYGSASREKLENAFDILKEVTG